MRHKVCSIGPRYFLKGERKNVITDYDDHLFTALMPPDDWSDYVGAKYCPVGSPDNHYYCARPFNHKGDHERVEGRIVLARWRK